jgi:hypothetical protein
MSNGLFSVVETVVNDKVQAGELFTAHDVTLEVRTRGHRSGHNEVRDAVHDYYDRGGFGIGYTRTIITVPSGSHPYLYHRGVDDPSTYNKVRGGAKSGPKQVSSNNNSSISIPPGLLGGDSSPNSSDDDDLGSSKSKNDFTRLVDNRKTLSVPVVLIRQAGFKAGQKVYAVAHADGVKISSDQPTPASVFGKYTVDSYSQVRITQHLLSRAGIAGEKYTITRSNDNILIKLSR